MKNIYHRYIDLPFSLEKPDLFNRTHDRPYLWMGPDYIPKVLEDWLKTYNLQPSKLVEAFYTGAQKSIFVHTDFDQLPGVNDPAKLNFTWGPLNSVTRWWKIKDPSLYGKYTNTEVRQEEMSAGVESAALCETIWIAKNEDVEMVYEKVIDKPSLLNVGQLHSTFNPGSEDRWTWSFAMLDQNNEAISFNQALEIFKDIIHE